MSTADFDVLWNFSDPATTEQKFLALVPDLQTRPEALLELQTQLARTHSLRKQFEQAHQILDGLQAHLDQVSPRVKVRYLLERGRTWNSAGEREQASLCFQQAFELADQAGLQGFAADALHMLAISKPDQAISLNHQALDYIVASVDPAAKKWEGSLLNNLGWSYFADRRFEEALETFQKALQFREAQGQKEPIRIAWWCIARVLRELGHRDAALEIQLRLKAELEAAGSQDPYVDEELVLLK
ncbi:tetratricopeptide repeat protein [Deinococcus roseus]|uniref:Tetratricopeptide repeat protein n=1 Tax=Deinococcus roseus TaxID=392414 RepID=A0ABQ2CWF7_9DEIO|nr:tetratricopeptide repeat protein [Deinococcus roseus]GGJ26165.1 hypothetical protein GCM10008938_10430 [Deinococcus roseus]